jgi:GT2 family glycosyltransferase
MPYSIVEIEVTRPLPAIVLSEAESGAAFLIRRKGKPIDFWIESLPPGSALTPGELSRRIASHTGARLLRENLREERADSDAPPEADGFPSLTIAICTRERTEGLTRCLNSLRGQDGNGDSRSGNVEILVIDNAPATNRTEELCRAMRGVRRAVEPKPGLDFARNLAIREASGEVIAFLDDDVIVDRGWLAGLAQAWAENRDAAAFTGLVLPLHLATEAQILFEKRGGFRRGFEKIRYHGPTLPGNPLFPCGAGIFGAGANMAFRRDILLDLGGFDEALDTGPTLPGGGDLDIFYRLVRAGHPLVYEPEFLVFHEHRRDLEALRRQCWSWGLGFMAFVAKSRRSDRSQARKFRRLVRWWFGDQIRQLARSMRGRYCLPANMILSEMWGGIVGLLGEYGRSSRRVARLREAAR